MVICLGYNCRPNGEMSDYLQLTPGEHILLLTVEDTMGKTSTEEIQVQVNEVNHPAAPLRSLQMAIQAYQVPTLYSEVWSPIRITRWVS